MIWLFISDHVFLFIGCYICLVVMIYCDVTAAYQNQNANDDMINNHFYFHPSRFTFAFYLYVSIFIQIHSVQLMIIIKKQQHKHHLGQLFHLSGQLVCQYLLSDNSPTF